MAVDRRLLTTQTLSDDGVLELPDFTIGDINLTEIRYPMAIGETQLGEVIFPQVVEYSHYLNNVFIEYYLFTAALVNNDTEVKVFREYALIQANNPTLLLQGKEQALGRIIQQIVEETQPIPQPLVTILQDAS